MSAEPDRQAHAVMLPVAAGRLPAAIEEPQHAARGHLTEDSIELVRRMQDGDREALE